MVVCMYVDSIVRLVLRPAAKVDCSTGKTRQLRLFPIDKKLDPLGPLRPIFWLHKILAISIVMAKELRWLPVSFP